MGRSWLDVLKSSFKWNFSFNILTQIQIYLRLPKKPFCNWIIQRNSESHQKYLKLLSSNPQQINAAISHPVVEAFKSLFRGRFLLIFLISLASNWPGEHANSPLLFYPSSLIRQGKLLWIPIPGQSFLDDEWWIFGDELWASASRLYLLNFPLTWTRELAPSWRN